jgi:hypothetical protein
MQRGTNGESTLVDLYSYSPHGIEPCFLFQWLRSSTFWPGTPIPKLKVGRSIDELLRRDLRHEKYTHLLK